MSRGFLNKILDKLPTLLTTITTVFTHAWIYSAVNENESEDKEEEIIKITGVLPFNKNDQYDLKLNELKEVADKLNDVKRNNKKIIAVGTTSTRVLETIRSKYNEFKENRFIPMAK